MARLWLRWFILMVVIVILAGCSARERGQIKGADAPPDAVPDLAGWYYVNGFDPLGTEYGGNLTIMPGNSPGQYKLQWIITGSIQEGIGTLDGNRLIVQWRTTEGMGPGATGVTTYTVTTERELYGTRSADGLEGVGTEKVFPIPGS